MTQPASAPPSFDPVRWLNNQPYLLLTLTSLFWAGNIVLARHVAGHVPPLTLSCVRWIGTFLILLPFALPHLKKDWPVLRAHLPMMLFLSLVGFAYNNAISYWALQYTEALNALLIQSAGPLFVALWSLALFGIRLTGAQLAGIAISLAGVLTIILRGDFGALASISFNRGDLMFASSLVSFGLYSALIPRRPVTHALSLISFTTCCGALMLVPFSIWEYSTGVTLKFDFISMATLGYAVIFPSTLAYLFFNRGLAHDRAQSRRAVLSSGAGVRLGDGDPAARRAIAVIPSGGLCAGAGRRGDRVAAGLGKEGLSRPGGAASYRLPLSIPAG